MTTHTTLPLPEIGVLAVDGEHLPDGSLPLGALPLSPQGTGGAGACEPHYRKGRRRHDL